MKKYLLGLGVLALCAASCAKTEKSAEQAVADNEVAGVERVAARAAAEAEDNIAGVDTPSNFVVLKDDAKYRPDMKPARLTILDFNATWCGPCRQFSPVFDQAAKAFPDVEFVSVDTDVNPQTAEAFGVTGIPHVAVVKPNGEIDNYVGTDQLMPYEKFAEIITGALDKK